MAHDVVFKSQRFTAVTEAELEQARSSPAGLIAYLEKHPGHDLDFYWQAVPYLIAGTIEGLEEPLRWFIDGGLALGENAAGPIRYLDRAQVGRLAQVLAEESPDELGHTHWDEAGMDAAGVYPARWVRDGAEHDELGRIRELYSYAREFLISSADQGKGVIVHLFDRLAFTEEEEEEAPEPAPTPPTPAVVGEVVLIAEDGSRFVRRDASAHPQAGGIPLEGADAAAKQLGFLVVGDFNGYGDDVIRGYLSMDRTIVALAYFSERGLGSWTFLSPLAGDALVVASDAFTQEIKKVKLFALSNSRADPATLHASVLERRAPLEKKHGAPVTLEPTLAAVAGVWNAYGEKSMIGPRRRT